MVSGWDLCQAPVFLQSIINSDGKTKLYFLACQEGRRKEVERGFGMLRLKWIIVALPSRFLRKGEMQAKMKCCVILHKMMVKQLNTLVELNSTNKAGAERVAEDKEYCYERDCNGRRSVPNTVSAMFDVQAYLSIRNEFRITRRSFCNHLVNSELRNEPP